MNEVIKALFQFTLDYDVALNLLCIPSKENLADKPSRDLNKTDATLSAKFWNIIQTYFGGSRGHTLDMMALDSNSMQNRAGEILRHCTPFQTPLSAGVNMFCQTVNKT